MTFIRPMTNDDLEFAVAQTLREGWATGRHMFEIYLAHDPDGCFIAENIGNRVGMVTTTRYRRSAWIGNLIVVPEARSHGIGRILMRHGLDHLEKTGISTVRLDGDPPGIPLYRSLGFVDEWQSLRFKGISSNGAVPKSVTPIESAHLDAIGALDDACFGDCRQTLLHLQLQHALYSFVVKRAGAVMGYLFMESTNLGLRIGPWVARDSGDAQNLLAAARCAAGPGWMLTLGVPAPNTEALDLLSASGFEAIPSCRRMIRGPRAAEGRLNRIFAIAGGAVG